MVFLKQLTFSPVRHRPFLGYVTRLGQAEQNSIASNV